MHSGSASVPAALQGMRGARLLFVLLLAAPCIRTLAAAGAPAAKGVDTANATAQLQSLADAWRLTPEQAAALNRSQDAGKIRICISPYSPQVYCEAGRPQESYTGYQVEVFREVAQRVSWLSNFDSWFFDCMAWTPMMDDMLSNNGTCLMSPSGIAATQERLEKGMRVSWVIDKEGYRIMTVPTGRELNLWTPFTVFSAPLWVLLFCTSIFVGVMLWLVDTRARSLLKPPPRHKDRSRKARKLRGSVNALLHGINSPPQHGNQQPQLPQQQPVLEAVQPAPLTCSLQNDGSCKSSKSSSLHMGPYQCCVSNGHTPVAVAAGTAAISGNRSEQQQQPQQQQQQQQHRSQDVAVQPLPDSNDMDAYLDQQQERSDSLLWWLGVRKGEEQHAIKRLKNNMSSSFLRMPDMGDPPAVQTLPAKIVLFAYGLLILIIVALYTASAAAQLTAQSLKSDIRSIDDLKGKAVVTWDGYADKLQEQGLPTIRMPWETNKDEEAMLNMVLSGQAKALILGATFVDLVTNERCEFAAVGESWNIMDSGIGYNKRMQRALQESMNIDIQAAIEDGSIERIYNIYIRKQGSHCNGNSPTGVEGEVGLEQVAGLWVLLALSLAVAAVILGVYWLKRYRKHVHMLAAHASQQMRKVSQSMGRSLRSQSRVPSWVATSTAVMFARARTAQPAGGRPGRRML